MDIMDTQQENALEKSLRLAADEPAHRPDFFKTLLNSTIYILGTTVTGEGLSSLEAGSNISIAHWQKPDGSAVIPFFSSLQTLQKSIDSEESYIEIPARSLFEITQGTPLFLNPKSPYGKEFFPEEVRHLLCDEIGQKPTQRTVEKDTQVLLGQPSQYPAKMVNSLTQLLATHHNVKRAAPAKTSNPIDQNLPCSVMVNLPPQSQLLRKPHCKTQSIWKTSAPASTPERSLNLRFSGDTSEAGTALQRHASASGSRLNSLSTGNATRLPSIS